MVLEDYRQYYQSLQDQLDDVRSTGKTRILQILDDQQRAKFEKIMGSSAARPRSQIAQLFGRSAILRSSAFHNRDSTASGIACGSIPL